ncbi:MAG: secretin N-terminal domain-containing protein [Steroidobacteraceae bacterium]
MSSPASLAPRRIWLPLALAAWLVASPGRAETLEAIPLHHRRAEEIIPLLQPLLPPGAVVTGTGDVLLVRADAATLQQLSAALASLDRAPRQLLITVGQDTGATSRSVGAAGSATVGSGDVQVGINRPPATQSGGQVVVQGSHGRDDIRNLSSVRALEGYEAYVAVGQSRAVPVTTVIGRNERGVVYGQSSTYREVQTGFYATPRLAGDRVTLEISPTQQNFSGAPGNPVIAGRSVTTTVSGRLGEWIELGGVDENQAGIATGLITWGTHSATTRYSAWVKVDEAP